MKKETKPELRFAGFTDDWEQRKFSDITYPAGKKNKDNLPLESYSVTNDNGFIPQSEQFENGGTMATADKSMYYIVSKNSFAYNPARINVGSIGYYQGFSDVIVSSLYEVFKTDSTVDDRFLWHWFETKTFQRMIERLQEGGVRLYFYYDKLCMGSILMPKIEEQRQISKLFDSLDSAITLHQRKCDALIKVKKSMLQKMFPKNGKSKPEVRFAGFTDDWEQRKLSDYLETSTEKNFNEQFSKIDVLSVSGDYGIVNQIEFKGRSFAGVSVANYGVVKHGDIVYTKSPLNLTPYGIIKTNKGKAGIVSTLYAIYHPKTNVYPFFVQTYFELNTRLNNYLHPLVNKGAKNDMKVSADNALKGSIIFPKIEEQKKISDFFRTLDSAITLHQREVEKLTKLKKALLSKMFI